MRSDENTAGRRGPPSSEVGAPEKADRTEDEHDRGRHAAQLKQLGLPATYFSAPQGVDAVAAAITAEARQLIGAHQAFAGFNDERGSGHEIRSASFSDRSKAEWSGNLQDLDAGLMTRIAKDGLPLRLTHQELEAHAAWAENGRGARRPMLRGWISTPLVGRDGLTIGLIALSDKLEGDFTEDDAAMLAYHARMAAVSLENEHLHQLLRQVDKQKDEFLATLAHELRNPLAAINNAVALIRLSQGRQHTEWGIDLIGRQVRGLARLIDDLIDVSRLTRGKIELRPEMLYVEPVIQHAVQSVQPLMKERQHQLTLDMAPDPLWLKADPLRLEQVLVNLLSNAAKYTDVGGRISLSARREDGEVVLRVRDDGQGIPRDSLATIFDLFAQGDRNLARSEGGLGIGLTLVKRLVQLHGGTVGAESEGPGKGTEFIVRLPAPEKAGPPNRDTIDPLVSRTTPILIADDNVDLAQGLARLLKIAGHEVEVVHDGPAAVSAAHATRPGLCLIDIGLPGMDGYEVAREIRRDPSLKDVILIAISGYSMDSDRRRSRESGFDHHIVKPIALETLRGLLDELPGKTRPDKGAGRDDDRRPGTAIA